MLLIQQDLYREPLSEQKSRGSWKRRNCKRNWSRSKLRCRCRLHIFVLCICPLHIFVLCEEEVIGLALSCGETGKKAINPISLDDPFLPNNMLEIKLVVLPPQTVHYTKEYACYLLISDKKYAKECSISSVSYIWSLKAKLAEGGIFFRLLCSFQQLPPTTASEHHKTSSQKLGRCASRRVHSTEEEKN